MKNKNIFMLVLMPVLMIALFPGRASAERFTGRISAISEEANAIAIEPFQREIEGKVFALKEGVVITREGRTAALDELRIGDLVTVVYHEEQEGTGVIDRIAVTSGEAEQQV